MKANERKFVSPKIGLSNRRKIPVWRLFDSTFAIWDRGKAVEKVKQAGLFTDGEFYFAKIGKWNFKLTRYYAGMIVNEFPIWESKYLPVNVSGKTVLDIGAGEGESAAFYLMHGASRVIAIEPDPVAFNLLRENVEANHLPVEPINARFSVSQLSIPHDFLKMDIEGYESALLDLPDDFALGDCIIEGHKVGERYIGTEIAKRFNLKIVQDDGRGLVLLNGLTSQTEKATAALLPNR